MSHRLGVAENKIRRKECDLTKKILNLIGSDKYNESLNKNFILSKHYFKNY